MENKITSKQGTVTVTLFIIGTSIVFGPGRSAKENEWISIILSLIIFVPIAFIYSAILEKNPGKSIFQICEMKLGKIIGKVFITLFTFHTFITMAVLLRNLGAFIYIVGPQETPMAVNMTCIGLLAVLSVYYGMNVLGRWCILFIPIVLFVLLIPIPFAAKEMKIDNLLPIMYSGIGPVISGVIQTLSFPITQTFMFIMVFEGLEDIRKFKWVLLKGVFLGGTVLLLIIISTILVEGGQNYENSYLPTYVALRRITVGKFFERLEIIVLITFVYTIFLKLSISLICTVRGLGYIFNFNNYKIISTVIVFLGVDLAYILYESSMESLYFINNVWPVYALLFQVVLPCLLFIILKVLGKRRS